MLSLRWYLVLLIAGTLFPVVLFGVAVVYRLSSQEQAASERRILLAARNLASTVERELSSSTRTLQALSSSQALDRGDLRAFRSEARRAAQTQSTWVSVILLTPEGQQVINTRQPFGKRLPSVIEPESLRRVVRTGQPTVGDLARGKLESLMAIPVRIPVMRGQTVQYVLTAVITQETIARVVSEQTSVDGEWTRTIVDGRGVVVARTRNPERFVGQRGTPSFLKRIGETTEGIYRDTTLDGVKVYVAFCRVGHTPWTAAITVPVDVVQSPAQRAMGLVIGTGFVLLLMSGIGAFILSRQISRSITSAATAAAALANGEYPEVNSLSIKEIALLGQSLEFAANLLSQRERERAENLVRVEAAREEAEAANRIKDEFLAVLSHELRTPLNPIVGWAGLLRTGRLDAEKTAFALETIERNAKLQTQLIEDLLDVSRIMQGKLSLTMVPVDLKVTIQAAIDTVGLAAEAKSIQIHTALDPTVGKVLGDAARLQQTIWNLLSNAIKFTPQGGQVEVSLSAVSSHLSPANTEEPMTHDKGLVTNYAQITIRDTGKGIHPNFLPHVFEYFRQEDGTTTRRFGGLGLGLAIVRHLVELHGGTVQVESPGEDLGATFTVLLPITQLKSRSPEDTTPVSASDVSDTSKLTGVRVLVVDDDADTRDFITLILENNQAIVTSVASAAEALKAFEHSSFDLLISDIGMPEVNGYQLMRQIRSQASQGEQRSLEASPVPKAIALTAYAGESDCQQALDAGFQRHIAKPVEAETLIRVIVDLMSIR